MNTKIGTEFLHTIIHFNKGIHAVCLFRQTVKFQLQHFIFCDGTYVIAALRITVKCIGIGVIKGSNIVIALGGGQGKEFINRIG